ncbi:MAG: HPr(Ser) kinase/phosphatase [Verrucomicrobia bacterium]|nr:HPr(Ser) kinase/phosphatase [Verrucomicrobiota bacterium]
MKQEPLTVELFFKEHGERLGLSLAAGAAGLKNVIREQTVNRPGLALAGFTKYFARHRIQVIGAAEFTFMKSLPAAEREPRYKKMLTSKIPCVVYSRDLKPDPILLKAAEIHQVPVFTCPLITMKFINLATLALENAFAPRGSEMGSMVDILGVGVIVKGESGIGKSECVLALIERGYSLVSDDITRVSLLDGKEVVGRSAELTRNHMEVRGIGIINVAAMFGIGSIRDHKRVDLVVSLRAWGEVPDVDRLGLEDEHIEILGIKVPHITIPVRPGRDIARLVEVAAFQTKLKASGYNPARELNERLLAQMAANK